MNLSDSATQNPPGRIVSLVPSLTEALFTMGAGSRVVGVTEYCEEPAALLQAVHRVGGTKNPDIGAILALAPDLVIASSEENRREDVESLRLAGMSVVISRYETVRESLAGLASLAALVAPNVPQPWLDEAVLEVDRSAARMRPPVPYFCPIWRRPYMIARADTYMADLLALAGGRNAVAATCADHYCPIELECLVGARPAMILLPSEPYPFAEKHLCDFQDLTDVPAVRERQIHFVDGKALTWYGPRITGALQHFERLFNAARAASTLQQPA